MPKYTVLDKITIKSEIMPYLSVAKRGFSTKADLAEVVNAILHKLKTGCQWAELPVEALFGKVVLSWNAVYHHFRKWCKVGEWQMMFANIVSKYKHLLDMSSTHIDGSHTPAIRGGEKVEYQGRKKRKTTNALYFSDNQGIPLAMSEPQSGNHADLFEIEDRVKEMTIQLKEAGLNLDGIFNNADAGFDSASFRNALETDGIISNVCPNPRNAEPKQDYLFDPELYKGRFVIERTNAWMDGFRSILNRYDTTISSWKGWNFLAFAVVFLKKIHKLEKFK